MSNALTVSDVSTILRGVLSVATGSPSASLETNQLITLAQTKLGTNDGATSVVEGLMQTLTRTFVSIRKYTGDFADLMVTDDKYGNMVRKLSFVYDKNMVEPSASDVLTDGKSVDQYKIHKAEILQTLFKGQQSYSLPRTFFQRQLKINFSNPAELGSFLTGTMMDMENYASQIHEETRRTLVSGAIAGIYADVQETKRADRRVVHLITEYNAKTGLSLNEKTIYAPDNVVPFFDWVFSKVNTVSHHFEDRGFLYSSAPTGKEPIRHTPIANQRLWIAGDVFTDMHSMALSNKFMADALKFIPSAKRVSYWQSQMDPGKIVVHNPQYVAASGDIKTYAATAATVTLPRVFAFLHDEDMLGVNVCDYRKTVTPMNASGEYWNTYFKFNDRHTADFTENGCVFLLD